MTLLSKYKTNNVPVSLQISKIDINWTNATRIFLIFCNRQVTLGKKKKQLYWINEREQQHYFLNVKLQFSLINLPVSLQHRLSVWNSVSLLPQFTLKCKVSHTVAFAAVWQDRHYSCHHLQSVTPLAKLTHTRTHVSIHSGSKCKHCVRGMRNKVNIALVWAIITARDDKKVSHSSCCGCSSSALVTEHNNSSVARSTPLRSESNREGLSFLLPVYKETPVQYGKATERRFTTPSEPGAREQRGARKKGTGTEKKRDHGGRRKKMVSRESRCPSEL